MISTKYSHHYNTFINEELIKILFYTKTAKNITIELLIDFYIPYVMMSLYKFGGLVLL